MLCPEITNHWADRQTVRLMDEQGVGLHLQTDEPCAPVLFLYWSVFNSFLYG